jgi:peroxiredoxin family protein
MNFAGAGPAMMQSLAKSHKVASPAELLALAKEMGLKREDLIDGLEEPAGATTALLAAQGASTLFI